MHFSTLFTAVVLVRSSIAGYVLEDDYSVDNFFSMFDFFTDKDPTNGFVKYVDQSTASNDALISTSNGAVYMGVDHTNETPNGRPSVRITSKKSYDSGLVILDIAHMPQGCGTWPAFWMVGPDWPNNGEIDIIEGVNEQLTNAMTLHTGPGCSITNGGGFSGSITTSNCDVNAFGQSQNAGCKIVDPSSNSYGAGLNANNGGVFATQWTNSAIKIFFFPRGSVPSDIGAGNPDPSGWGIPAASFKGACDIASTFKQQQIVFDTTFCGDWAGNVWTSGSCASKASTCNAYVASNPSAFANAYWTINSLKVYQEGVSKTSDLVSASSFSPSAVLPSVVIPTSDGSLRVSFPIPTSEVTELITVTAPASAPSTFAVSVSSLFNPQSSMDTETTSFPTLSLPTLSGASPTGAFPTGSGRLFLSGTASPSASHRHHHHHHHNGTNGTFPSGTNASTAPTRKTVYETVTITDTVQNIVTITDTGIEATPTPLTFSALEHDVQGYRNPGRCAGEVERRDGEGERVKRRRAKHLAQLRKKRHGESL